MLVLQPIHKCIDWIYPTVVSDQLVVIGVLWKEQGVVLDPQVVGSATEPNPVVVGGALSADVAADTQVYRLDLLDCRCRINWL